MRARAQPFLEDPKLVREIIGDGNSKARCLARETMRDVRQAIGLDFN
jgi:tryptophanyl-tRNA synthetase